MVRPTGVVRPGSLRQLDPAPEREVRHEPLVVEARSVGDGFSIALMLFQHGVRCTEAHAYRGDRPGPRVD